MSHNEPHFEKREYCDGRAVVYHGDCLDLLKSGLLKYADAIVSDPPYGINYHHNGRNVDKRGDGFQGVRVSTDRIAGDDQPFDPTPWCEMAGNNKPILLFGADHYKTRLPEGGGLSPGISLVAWVAPIIFRMLNLPGQTGATRDRFTDIFGRVAPDLAKTPNARACTSRRSRSS